MNIWNGNNKAFTLSFDDGIESDKKFLDIINYYGLKCTFNINSGLLGGKDSWNCNGFEVRRLGLAGIKELYEGHEIALHGTRHIVPRGLSKDALVEEFYEDKVRLTELFGQDITGMAYAYGVYDDALVEYLKQIGIKYARNTEESLDFSMPQDLLRLKPTCHQNNERTFELLDDFVEKEFEEPALFYLYGHSYEYDAEHDWTRLEQICEKISGYDNIFYGTNREVLGL